MAFTRDLMDGLGRYLDARDIGVWSPGGDWPADGVALTMLTLPEKPDRAIALTAYPLSDAVVRDESRFGLQVRCRGGPGDRAGGVDLADEAFDVLHGATHLHLNGIHVAQVLHTSGVSNGPDSSARWGWYSTYVLDLNRPSTHRPD